MTRLARHDDPRAAVFVPLSVGFLDDVDVNDCGALAQLVYVRSLLHAKRAVSDGLVSLRQIAGGLFGHVDPAAVETAAAELVAAGLWDATSHSDRYIITGWLKHNSSSVERSLERDAKRAGAHRTNHKLGRHDGAPVDGCPDCQDGPARERDASVTLASGSDSGATGERLGSDRGASPDERLRAGGASNGSDTESARNGCPEGPVSPGGNAPNAKRDASDTGANAKRGRYSDAETETETETEIQVLPVTQEGPLPVAEEVEDGGSTTTHPPPTEPTPTPAIEHQITDRLGYRTPPRNAAGLAAACRAAERAGHRPPAILAAGTSEHARNGQEPAAVAQRAIEALARQQPEPNPMANIAPDDAFPDPTAGWDTPEVTHNGIADARQALAGARRRRTTPEETR